MEKYQEILRDTTSRNFAAKKVTTSLVMLPLRLETKIKNKKISTVDEPHKVLEVFKSLWQFMNVYYGMLSAGNGTVSQKTADVEREIKRVIEEMNKLDAVYAEDKAYLKDITSNIYNGLHTVELQDAFEPVLTVLDDVTCLSSTCDKASTEFLNEMEHVTRLFEHTIRKPKFNGRARLSHDSKYSQLARFRTATRNYKRCIAWLDSMEDKLEPIVRGMFTIPQLKRYDALVERWNKVLNYYGNITGEKHGEFSTFAEYSIYNAAVLLRHYTFDPKKEGLPNYNEVEEIARLRKDKNTPVAILHKIEAYTSLKKVVAELLQKLWKCNEHLSGPTGAKDIGLWRRCRNSIKQMTIIGDDTPKRYTILVAKLLSARWQMVLAKSIGGHEYVAYSNRNVRRRLNNVSRLSASVYFNYPEERRWVKGVMQQLNTMMQGAKIKARLSGSMLDNARVLHNASLYSKKEEKCLCVRIYPDVAALTQAVREISRVEYLAGKDFWLKYIYTPDKEYQQSLWLAMCDLYPTYRAAFILKRTFPKGNYKVMCRKAKDFHDKKLGYEDFIREIDENFVNSFPTTYVDNGEDIFSVPLTDMMPDRFVVNAAVNVHRATDRTIVRYGHRLPKQLQVGLDLNNLEDSITQQSAGNGMQLFLNGGVRWMTDYDEAERMGMAITIPLKAMKTGAKGRTRSFEFSSIYVYGISDAPDDEASRLIEEMFTSHLYSDKAMDIISFDTVSNILTEEDKQYAFDSSENVLRERFQYQPHNCIYPHKPEPGNDLYILDRLFCLKESVLGNIDVPGEAGTAEVELSRRVNRLMIDYLTDSRLNKVINPLLNAIKNDATLYDFLCNDVLSRGPLPMLRISDQPYGILPVTDLRRLAVNSSHPLAIVKKILVLLTVHWNTILSTNMVNCYGKGGNKDTVTTQDYLDILGNTPRTTSFYSRTMVGGKIVDASYFRGELYHHQIQELYDLAKGLGLVVSKEDIKAVIPNYDFVPLIDKAGQNADVDTSVMKVQQHLGFDNIVNKLHADLTAMNENCKTGLVLNTDKAHLRRLVIEFFDLFNYRLDAWVMGLLNNKLRQRMSSGRHRVALGCFGWLFNLKEHDGFKLGCTNEYILAPSINQAVTGAVLRSSYNNSLKNGKAHDYDMGVNLSSERMRTAIRIIEGIQNGLSIGAILGADMERFIHEAYKNVKSAVTGQGLELDACIYPLRQQYPLVESEDDKQEDVKPSITVLNAAKLLEDYRAFGNNESAILNWLMNTLHLFAGNNEQKAKCEYLRQIIDWIDDEYDALTDAVLSESVYQLTMGNTEASDAISRALDEMKNIPMPQVAEIPITSAQIDGHMLAMLPAEPEYISNAGLLAQVEPKVEAWLRQMMFQPEQICTQTVEGEGDNAVRGTTDTLGKLGVSASELVYLSAEKGAFTKFLEVLNWLKNGKYEQIDIHGSLIEDADDIHGLDECLMAIDDLRNLLGSAHALRNDDLVKETGIPSEAEYDNLSSSYHNLEGYMIRLMDNMTEIMTRQQEVQNPESADYAEVALPDDVMLEAVRLLLDCYRAGQTNALDAVSADILIGDRVKIDSITQWKAIVAAQHSVFSSMKTVYDVLKTKLAEAKNIVENADDKNFEVYGEAIKKLVVTGYVIVPSFTPDANVPLEALAKQTKHTRYANVDAMVVENTISELALVEKPIMNLHQLRLFQKCNDIDTANIAAMQIVSGNKTETMKEWLGVAVSSEEMVTDAFTYLVMNPEHISEAVACRKPRISGLVIDHWIDRIPYRDQTAAVAFGYDQPDAEAPQTILLALATKDNARKGWNESMLLNGMKSAVHMMKCRTVNPDMLSRDGWASGLFPLLEYKDFDNKSN